MSRTGWGCGWHDYLDAVTSQWIGWSLPPAVRTIEQSGWSPDDRAAYCGRCGDSVGAGEATERGCASCRPGAEFSGGIADGMVRLGPYADPLRGWILSIKYHGWAEMAYALGRKLGEAVLASGMVEPERSLVVPMAMPWQRRMYRGIDHSRIIAAGVAAVLDAPVAAILGKKNGPPQVSLAPSRRRQSSGKSFWIRRRWGGWPVDQAHVILVDDVRTTGATSRGASRLLRTLGPDRVVCAMLGVADSKARLQRFQATGALQHALDRKRNLN